MKTQLISLDYHVPPCDTHLERFPVVIGYAADAGIRLEDTLVSDHHCQIDCVHGALVIRDLDSVHGTYVNGARLTAQLTLSAGDEISIGNRTFLLRCGEPCGPGEAVRAQGAYVGAS